MSASDGPPPRGYECEERSEVTAVIHVDRKSTGANASGQIVSGQHVADSKHAATTCPSETALQWLIETGRNLLARREWQ